MLDIRTMKLENIFKYFDGTAVVKDVSFSMEKGKIYSIIGENGAGKSTVVKIMNGTYAQEKGSMYINEKEVAFSSPSDAAHHGIGMVYQELHLLPNLSVTENIFVSHLTDNKFGIVNWKLLREKAQRYMEMFNLEIDPDALVGELKIAHQQIVAIIRTYAMDNRVMILDEPTSALPVKDIGSVLSVVKKLIELGCIIIYISHKLDEVLEISDEIIAMRNGEKIGEFHAGEMSKNKMVELIAGKSIEKKFPKKHFEQKEELLRFENVTVPGFLENISFSLHRGEILGFSGLLGAGKTEIAKTLFGIFGTNYTGDIYLNGKKYFPKNPKNAIHNKIGLVPENRASEGLILEHSVKNNAVASCMGEHSSFGWFNGKGISELVNRLVQELRIKCSSILSQVRTLSGGNQQKVVLSKWMAANADFIIFDEPTRGIDVGAKFEIYNLMNALVEKGVGVIIMSSELDEVLGMADRTVVLKEGKIIDIVASGEITEEEILAMS